MQITGSNIQLVQQLHQVQIITENVSRMLSLIATPVGGGCVLLIPVIATVSPLCTIRILAMAAGAAIVMGLCAAR